MYENSAEKLKVAISVIASIMIGLMIMAGVVYFFLLVESDFFLALLVLIGIAGLGTLGVWLTFLVYAVIADIGINTGKIVKMMDDMEKKYSAYPAASSYVPTTSAHPAVSASKRAEDYSYNSAAGQPQGKIPAWKRVEMEASENQE